MVEGDRPAGEDNLVVDDIVTAEALTGSVESVSTAKEEPTDTNGTSTASRNSDIVRLKVSVDSGPSGARADASNLGLGIVGGLAHKPYISRSVPRVYTIGKVGDLPKSMVTPSSTADPVSFLFLTLLAA